MASSISSWRSFIKTPSRIQPASRGLRYWSWRQRFDRDLRMQSDVEHIEDLGRPLQGNSEVFIPLIARLLGFMHSKPARELALGDALGDTGRDEQMSHGAQVIQLGELPSLQPLIG